MLKQLPRLLVCAGGPAGGAESSVAVIHFSLPTSLASQQTRGRAFGLVRRGCAAKIYVYVLGRQSRARRFHRCSRSSLP